MCTRHMCAGAYGDQKRALHHLDLELQAAAIHLHGCKKLNLSSLEDQEMPNHLPSPQLHVSNDSRTVIRYSRTSQRAEMSDSQALELGHLHVETNTCSQTD